MGDMNCNFFNGNNEFSSILKHFVRDNDLYCAFDSIPSFDPSSEYTRCNFMQNSFTLLDYVFVSRDLIKYIESVEIINSGSVLSDHLPVSVSFSIDISSSLDTPNPMPLPSNVDWRSVNDHIRLNYERIMEQSLNQIQIPHIVHGCTMCHETDHIFQIERYYSEIIRCIELANQSLPRCKPSVRKTN